MAQEGEGSEKKGKDSKKEAKYQVAWTLLVAMALCLSAFLQFKRTSIKPSVTIELNKAPLQREPASLLIDRKE